MMWYGHHNKTEAPIDAGLKWQIAGWIFLYVVLVWFVATSRRKKFQSLAVGTLAISSGALLSIGVHDVNWLTGCGEVSGSYSRWTEMKHGHQEMLIPARISVHIGLSEMNVTLKSYDPRMKFYYNEHIDFQPRTRQNRYQYNTALYKGLPNPILSVLDFIIFNDCYFTFTQLGYVTRYVLSGCCIIWAVNLVILLMVPEISAKVGLLNSFLTFITTLKYMIGVNVDFYFYVEGRDIHVSFGRSVYMVLVSAFLQAVPAFLVFLNLYPRTSFEVDFDSPWDKEELAKCSTNFKKDTKPVEVHEESIFSELKSSFNEVQSNNKDIIITMEVTTEIIADSLEEDSGSVKNPDTEFVTAEIEEIGKPREDDQLEHNETLDSKVTSRRSTEEMLEELRAKIYHKKLQRVETYREKLKKPPSIMSLLRSGRRRSTSTLFSTSTIKSMDQPPVTKQEVLKAAFAGLQPGTVQQRSPSRKSDVRLRSPTPGSEFRRRSPARNGTAEPKTSAQFQRNHRLE